jgi:hypothetical protein
LAVDGCTPATSATGRRPGYDVHWLVTTLSGLRSMTAIDAADSVVCFHKRDQNKVLLFVDNFSNFERSAAQGRHYSFYWLGSYGVEGEVDDFLQKSRTRISVAMQAQHVARYDILVQVFVFPVKVLWVEQWWEMPK